MNSVTNTLYHQRATLAEVVIPAGLGYLACSTVAVLNPLTAALFIGGTTLATHLLVISKSNDPKTRQLLKTPAELGVTSVISLAAGWPSVTLVTALGLKYLMVNLYKMAAPETYIDFTRTGKWIDALPTKILKQESLKESAARVLTNKYTLLIAGGTALAELLMIAESGVPLNPLIALCSLSFHPIIAIATCILNSRINEDSLSESMKTSYLKDKCNSNYLMGRVAVLSFYVGALVLTQWPTAKIISAIGIGVQGILIGDSAHMYLKSRKTTQEQAPARETT